MCYFQPCQCVVSVLWSLLNEWHVKAKWFYLWGPYRRCYGDFCYKLAANTLHTELALQETSRADQRGSLFFHLTLRARHNTFYAFSCRSACFVSIRDGNICLWFGASVCRASHCLTKLNEKNRGECIIQRRALTWEKQLVLIPQCFVHICILMYVYISILGPC